MGLMFRVELEATAIKVPTGLSRALTDKPVFQDCRAASQRPEAESSETRE